MITYVRVADGELPSRARIRLIPPRDAPQAEAVTFRPTDAGRRLGPGEVGYLVTG